MSFLNNLLQDERGQDLIEYALLAGFVALMTGAIMPSVSGQIDRIYTKIYDHLETAAAGSR